MEDEFVLGGYVCQHLATDNDVDPYYWFTGHGSAFNIICSNCKENLVQAKVNLVKPPTGLVSQFRWIEGMIGTPEILVRTEQLHFEMADVELKPSLPLPLATLKPLAHSTKFQWIGVLENATLIGINTDSGSWEVLYQIPREVFTINLAETGRPWMDARPSSWRVGLHISPNERYVAVTNDNSMSGRGVVIDLQEQRVIVALNRKTYHSEYTCFPFAFFEHQGKTLFIHATDWNRVDISDAVTGELLTDRDTSDHYIDYFYGVLLVSPDNQWVAEDGWVWQPVGVPRVWNLQRWLANKWETETDRIIEDLVYQEDWGDAFCWINETTLALWGFGTFSSLPAARLFDVITGRLIKWFPGPYRQSFFYDKYLFSASYTDLSAWDIETGEQIAHHADFAPIAYHPMTKQFVNIIGSDRVRLARLAQE